VYYIWPINELLPCPLEELFTCPLPLLTETEAYALLKKGKFTTSPLPLEEIVKEETVLGIRYPLPFPFIRKEFIRKTLQGVKWSPQILEQVLVEQSTYKLNRSIPSIHARGTDLSPSKVLASLVEDALRTLPSKVFLSTDDPLLSNKVKILKKFFPQLITFPREGRSSKEGIKEALCDLLLLSRTNITYYSPRSTFSLVALYLSDLPLCKIKFKEQGILERF